MHLWGMTRLVLAILAHMASTMVAAWKYQELVELESDAVNSVDFCKRVNKVTVPEMVGRAGVTVFLFLTGHWIVALLALPLDVFHFMQYRNKSHLFDPTDIMARVHLSAAKKVALWKMVYQAAFFITLFVSLIVIGVLEFMRHPLIRNALLKRLFPWV